MNGKAFRTVLLSREQVQLIVARFIREHPDTLALLFKDGSRLVEALASGRVEVEAHQDDYQCSVVLSQQPVEKGEGWPWE